MTIKNVSSFLILFGNMASNSCEMTKLSVFSILTNKKWLKIAINGEKNRHESSHDSCSTYACVTTR